MIHTPACKVQLTSSLPTYDRNFFLSPLGPKKTLCNFPICWIWLEKIRFERKRCRGRKSVRSRREINNSFQQVLHFVTPCIFPPLFWVNPKKKKKSNKKGTVSRDNVCVYYVRIQQKTIFLGDFTDSLSYRMYKQRLSNLVSIFFREIQL